MSSDTSVTGPRPDGIAGLLIDEIVVRMIVRTQKGYVAYAAVPPHTKSYLLRDGDQVYDGDVINISKSEVVFKQIGGGKPREVVKTIEGGV